MTDRTEDMLGRVAMIAIFGALSALQAYSIVQVIMAHANIALWPLVLLSRVFGLVFQLLVVIYTIGRLPLKKNAAGLAPRIVAIAGTFLAMFLVVLPSSPIPPELKILAMVLTALGTAASAFCLSWLGRSFSIMASSRRLVVEGPYKLVRHPLYAAEGLTVLGILIANWSLAAGAVGLLWIALQYQRAINEENVLSESFPEYAAYAKAVPRFVPGFFFAFGGHLREGSR
ncbi:MAG TPA: isoprenylcysteine carboxylmethyltransferase family protein [Rhizomicrobium sp.]|jgi:protein-S-isoprenylcysteine O-methyltransferase Ste14